LIVELNTRLDWPLQDGSTKRQHLLSIAKQTGKIPEELEVPAAPSAGLYIKNIFDQLSSTRNWSNGYPQQISQADIYYWCKLNNTKLSRKHLLIVKKLDVTQINSFIDCIKEK